MRSWFSDRKPFGKWGIKPRVCRRSHFDGTNWLCYECHKAIPVSPFLLISFIRFDPFWFASFSVPRFPMCSDELWSWERICRDKSSIASDKTITLQLLKCRLCSFLRSERHFGRVFQAFAIRFENKNREKLKRRIEIGRASSLEPISNVSFCHYARHWLTICPLTGTFVNDEHRRNVSAQITAGKASDESIEEVIGSQALI
jgi:hypothetical protein